MAYGVSTCSRGVTGGSIETVFAKEKLVGDGNLVDKRVYVTGETCGENVTGSCASLLKKINAVCEGCVETHF